MNEAKVSDEQEKLGQETEKQLEQQSKNYLSPRDYVAYNLSGTGDKNWESFSGTNSDFFNRTILGADPAILSYASMISSVADTFDNAISGPIIDRTRTRWGRVRPYLIITLPVWLAATAAPWLFPGGLSQTLYLVLFAAVNYLGSIANSFYGPAYSALLYNLTPNVSERNRLIAADTYFDLILGSWLPSIFSFFVDFMPSEIDRRSIYMGGAFFFIVLVVVFRCMGFFILRERVPLASRQSMKQASVWKSVRQCITCRPMWVLLIKNFFGVGKAVGGRVSNDFWLNCFGKLSYGSVIGLFTGLPSYFVLPFAPRLTEKIGLRNLGSLSYLFCGVSYIIMYFIGYAPFGRNIINVIWMVLALTVCGSVNSIQRYCSTAMTGDMYDYVEWKTGIRNEGLLSAAMGYITLLSNQLSTFFSGFLLKVLGIRSTYVGGKLVPSTDIRMKSRVWLIFALAPGIGRTLKGITLLFFNVHGKTKEKMMRELAAARAEKIIDTGVDNTQ